MTDLASRLYAALAAEPGNLVCSPYSVAVALDLAAYGARGRTLEELRAVVGDAGRPVEDPDLRSANRLFGQAGLAWAPDLARLLTVVDYGDAEAARALVNAWTAEQTGGRIPAIVPPGVLDAETLLVLVNALHLKAAWAAPFPEHATADADFRLADGSVVRVPTMAAQPRVAVGSGPGWRSARLPYVGGRLALTVVLADDLGTPDLRAVLEAPSYARLALALPRFTVRTAAPLGEVLASLGMPTAFTDDADFSGLVADAPLKISAVLHEAFVAVDEHGTEAAAATAVVMARAGAAPETPVPFVVDRPFLFVVHTVADRVPLFVGRVVDPRS